MRRQVAAALTLAWASSVQAEDAPVPTPAVPASAASSSVIEVSPPKLIPGSCTRPEYPLASVRAKESGTTLVNVSVKENGEVTQAVVRASSGYPRLDGAARETFAFCKYRPSLDPRGNPIPGTALMKHVWRLEDAAPDPWVGLRAASGKATWAATEDFASVVFTTQSETTPEQRAKILRRVRDVAAENASCAHIGSVTASPPPADWKTPPVIDPKTGREIRIVRELWNTTQCGIPMDYVLVMRFPDEEPASFLMIPIAPRVVPTRAAPGPVVSYGERIGAAVRANILFAPGESNPLAEVELKLAPDGRITATRLSKRSGEAAWDQAVLAAVGKTSRLPLDNNGKVPPTVVLSLRPR